MKNILTTDKLIEQSIHFAKERMTHPHSSHGWDHVERVITLSALIAETEPAADRFIVHCSAVLHDIARADEMQGNGALCHAREGGEIAYGFLINQGLDEVRAAHIRDCIMSHRYRGAGEPATIEAKILYDADKLDSIGAVGIGRAFLFSGEVGARLHNSDIDPSLTEAYGREDTAFREYMVKLRHVREKMLTAEGKRRADLRHNFMEEFFSRFDDEVKGLV